MALVSRRRLAQNFALAIKNGKPRDELVRELAAYLIDHKQLSSIDLYVNDIEAELAKDGTVVADVSTARPLDETSRTRVKDYLLRATNASAISLREHVDADLIGGIVIRTAGHELDASVASQLRQLKTAH